MTEANVPVAENMTSKQGSVVIAYHEATQCYFCPETEELVFIAASHAGKFETHWRVMNMHMDEFHQAKGNYSSALEHLAHAAATSTLSSLERGKRTTAVSAAESELEQKRKALQEHLGQFSLEGMSYDDVVELIPVFEKGVKNRRGSKPKPYVYVKKQYFRTTQEGRKLHTVALKGKDKKSAKESIYSKDKNGNTRIDTSMLAKQLTDLQWPKLKLELQDVLKWSGSDFDLDTLKSDFVLFDWAESWNNSLLAQTEGLGANVDVSRGAQFMRFASNVGASAQFDLAEGQASIKGEAKASVTMASASVNLEAFVPDRLGWKLSYTSANGHEFEMGMLRLHIIPQLTGFIGASVVVEGQLQVVVKGNQQMLVGQPGGRLPRFTDRNHRGAVFYKQMAEEDEGLQLTGEAFAGARAEASLSGGLQWLKPTPPPGVVFGLDGILKSTGEYTNFCTIGSNISGLAGAGIGGKFNCTFINGRFCFHVAASLCWGLGAKGGLIFEVGVNTIVEFGAWLVYQLYRLDYGFFELVDSDAFEAYSQYCVMQMADIEDNIYALYNASKIDVQLVYKDFLGFIRNIADEGLRSQEASQRRNRLATNTIAQKQDLLRYTPESKGMLLYLLTRHGKWDRLDTLNYGGDLLPDPFNDRKEAVLWVLRSIQTLAEWKKVLSRVTPDGTRLEESDSIVIDQEQKIVDFLQLGFNRDQDMYDAKANLSTIRNSLKKEVAWGYALAMNNTNYYKLNVADNPHYPQRCVFGPCEKEPVV